MNKVETELDASQAIRGHFRGRKLRFIGDATRVQNPPPSTGSEMYRFTLLNNGQIDVAADSEKAARQWLLAYFKWPRMPRGVVVERLTGTTRQQ